MKLVIDEADRTDRYTYSDEFMECDTCRAKPGTPLLCAGCISNRSLIERLKAMTPTEPEKCAHWRYTPGCRSCTYIKPFSPEKKEDWEDKFDKVFTATNWAGERDIVQIFVEEKTKNSPIFERETAAVRRLKDFIRTQREEVRQEGREEAVEYISKHARVVPQINAEDLLSIPRHILEAAKNK